MSHWIRLTGAGPATRGLPTYMRTDAIISVRGRRLDLMESKTRVVSDVWVGDVGQQAVYESADDIMSLIHMATVEPKIDEVNDKPKALTHAPMDPIPEATPERQTVPLVHRVFGKR